MPSRPARLAAIECAKHDPQSPYEKIAAERRRSILCGVLADGDLAPTDKQLAAEHQMAIGTTQTATAARLWAIAPRGPDGRRYPARHVCDDINCRDSFRAHLLAIARIEEPRDTNGGDDWIGDYELEFRESGKEHMDPALTHSGDATK